MHPLLWPLIFALRAARGAQRAALKHKVRARYGRGVPYVCFVRRWGGVTLTFAGTQGFARSSAAGSSAPIVCSAAQAAGARLMRALAAEGSVTVPPVRALRVHSVHVHSKTGH